MIFFITLFTDGGYPAGGGRAWKRSREPAVEYVEHVVCGKMRHSICACGPHDIAATCLAKRPAELLCELEPSSLCAAVCAHGGEMLASSSADLRKYALSTVGAQ